MDARPKRQYMSDATKCKTKKQKLKKEKEGRRTLEDFGLRATSSLNLCGVHAVESSIEVKCLFGNILKLDNFFSNSSLRWKVVQDT